jgi:non-canonical (house-cleaning) NTP pyrophosphatase
MRVHNEIMDIVHSGKELGDAIDEYYGDNNLKQKVGFFGMATKSLITRSSGYKDAVISALSALPK